MSKAWPAVSNAFAGFTERAAQYFPSNSRYNNLSEVIAGTGLCLALKPDW